MKINILWIDGIEQEFKIEYNHTGTKEYYIRNGCIDFTGRRIVEIKDFIIPLKDVRWVEVLKDA